MKKLFCILLTLALALSLVACGGGNNNEDPVSDLAAIQDAGVLRVGMECNYAPFNWTQADESEFSIALDGGGYADGYDVQMAMRIAEGLGVELEIVKLEWDGLTMALESGLIDCIIAGMSPTEERKATIDFTDHYYESELVIVVRADSEYADATSLSDFAGARITGQLNTFHYEVISQIEGVEAQTALENFPAMIVALQSDAIDGYVSELPGAVSAQAANPDLTYVQFADGEGFVASEDEVAVSVGIRKGSDLADPINEILAGISEEDRLDIMNAAVARQPVTQE